MVQKEITTQGYEAIIAKFPCAECGYWIKTDEISIPSPDMTAERTSDSYNDNYENIECPKCGKEHAITVCNSFVDGYVEIEELEAGTDLEIDLVEDDDYYDREYEDGRYDLIADNVHLHADFKSEIDGLIKLNEVDLGDPKLNQIIKKQIFVGVITSLETFLSDVFINLTMGGDEYLKNFIESHPELKKQQFTFDSIYEAYEQRGETAKRVMLGAMYHNLTVVARMYHNTFKVKFPECRELIKHVDTRHHLVHRGGKTKEGVQLEITKKEVNEVIEAARTFVYSLATSLNIMTYDLSSMSMDLISPKL